MLELILRPFAPLLVVVSLWTLMVLAGSNALQRGALVASATTPMRDLAPGWASRVPSVMLAQTFPWSFVSLIDLSDGLHLTMHSVVRHRNALKLVRL